MTTRVRAARDSDLDAVMRIEQAAFEPVRRASRRALRHALVSPRQLVLVCETGGAVSGYAILWRFKHTWRLYSIATLPDARGRGDGSLLLRTAIDTARAGGGARLQLEARPEPALLRWYGRHGFEVWRRLPDYYGPGDDAVRMRQVLRGG